MNIVQHASETPEQILPRCTIGVEEGFGDESHLFPASDRRTARDCPRYPHYGANFIAQHTRNPSEHFPVFVKLAVMPCPSSFLACAFLERTTGVDLTALVGS